MIKVHISDRLLVSILFIIMTVFSTVMVLNLRENTNQTAKLRDAVETSRVLSGVGIICTLDTSGAVNTGVIPYTPEAIKKYVNECIAREIAQNHSDTLSTVTSTTK